MKRRHLLCLLAAGAMPPAWPRPVAAHGYRTRTIDIAHPWTFEQEGKGVDAIIRMTLTNKGKLADALVRVRTTDAERAELRDHRQGQDRIALQPGSTVTLHEAGPHILLRGVRKTLFAYNTLRLTLEFARARPITVEVVVEDKPA